MNSNTGETKVFFTNRHGDFEITWKRIELPDESDFWLYDIKVRRAADDRIIMMKAYMRKDAYPTFDSADEAISGDPVEDIKRRLEHAEIEEGLPLRWPNFTASWVTLP